MRFFPILVLLFSASLSFAHTHAPFLKAAEVTAANAPALLQGGDKAHAGIGDWFVGNGEVCALISAAEHENDVIEGGGYLTDIGHCGLDNDRFIGLFPLYNLDSTARFTVNAISSRSDATMAEVLTEASAPGLAMTVQYRVEPGKPYLSVISKLRKTDPDANLTAMNWITMTAKASTVFDLSSDGTAAARGTRHKPLTMSLWEASEAFSASDMQVILPHGDWRNSVTYGQQLFDARLVHADGSESPLRHFFVHDKNYVGLVIFAETFWVNYESRGMSMVELLQTQLMSLAEGDELQVTQRIYVGEGYQVSAISDQLWADGGAVAGALRADQLPASRVPVHVFNEAGEPVSQTFSRADGTFTLRLPNGRYTLQIRPQGREMLSRTVDVDGGLTQLGEIGVQRAATLTLPRGEAMRLTFFGPGKKGKAALGAHSMAQGIEGKGFAETRDLMLAGVHSDPAAIDLPAGEYRVIASRGPLYTVHEARINLLQGKTSALEIGVPEKEIIVPNYVSADLHVHAAKSFDNGFPLDERVRSYAAQGGDVLVATEHETIYDYTADIKRLGLSDSLATVTGTELTGQVATEDVPHTIGHGNIFPLQADPYIYRRGQTPHEGRRWRDVMAEVRGKNPDTVIQLNHARDNFEEKEVYEQGSIGYRHQYLRHLGTAGAGFDAKADIKTWPNSVLFERDPKTGIRDIDFDAIELINGTTNNLDGYKALRKDWFAFLRAGVRMTATATSDSHSNRLPAVVLQPRAMVYLAGQGLDFDPGEFDEKAFITAIKQGRLYGTTGPLLDVSVDGAGLGELVVQEDAQALSLKVRATAPAWIGVDSLRVFVNGELQHAQDIAPNKEYTLPLPVQTTDAFITVEVQGPRTAPFSELVPVIPPFAFTNPIYVDADGDGLWQGQAIKGAAE
jgi:hypothetical protein